MNADQFLYERLKQDVRLHRGMWIVLAVVAIAAVIAGIVGTAMGKGVGGGITIIVAGASMGLYAFVMRKIMQANQAALDEIGPDPTNLVDREDLSERTRGILNGLLLSRKEYRGQAIAYGIIALVMVAGAVVIIAVCIGSEPGLLPFGGLLIVGAILLGQLSLQAARNLKTATKILELEEREFEERFGSGD